MPYDQTFPADYSFSKIGLYTYAPIPVPVVDVKLGLAANIVILNGVKTVNEAIRTTPPGRTTIRNGQVLSKTMIEEELFC